MAAYWKAFQSKEEWRFLFRKIFLFFLEIFTFLYNANEESDSVIGGSTKRVQHSIKNISRNIGAVSFKLGTRNVQKKQNDTYVVAMTLGSSLFSWKTKYPHLQSLKVGQRVARHTNGSHIDLTITIRLLWAVDLCLG